MKNWIKENKGTLIGTGISLIGIILLDTIDWKIAAGVYLIVWGAKIDTEFLAKKADLLIVDGLKEIVNARSKK